MSERTFRFSIELGGSPEGRPRVARRWVIARFAELGLEYPSANLPLLVSELVTNACIHGADPVTLRLEMTNSRARVEVEDSVPELPDVQSPTERDPGGRGLLIVESLSHGWGVERTATGGKVVWAEVLMEAPGNEELAKADCL
jgi:anti-sigma regulatory factor (Ser/Thr protein kinase)